MSQSIDNSASDSPYRFPTMLNQVEDESQVGLFNRESIVPVDDIGDDQRLIFDSLLQSNQSISIQDYDMSRAERMKRWAGVQRTKIVLGVAAASLAVTVTTNPVTELKDAVLDAAPWVAPGILGSEVAFAAGAAMMLGAIGSKVGNPLKVKERIPEIAERANNSALFKTGFWLNATGAVGDFGVISAGVLKEMPVSSYPLLSLTLLDLAGTIAVRKAILNGVARNTTMETERKLKDD